MLLEPQLRTLAALTGDRPKCRPAQRHHANPWRPAYLHCPRDQRQHRYGCRCARHLPHLIPGSLRAWYRRMWAEGK